MMTTEMTTAVKYSSLPCPYGCSLSAGLQASFIPMMVTDAENASERLFTASSTMAIEFDKSPAAALNTDSSTLTPTPVQLVRIILFSLSGVEDTAFPMILSVLVKCKNSK